MKIKLYGMVCGHITMPQNLLLADVEGEVTIPLPCYLVEHPKGTVIFDTGLEYQIHQPDGDLDEALGPLGSFATVTLAPGEDVSARLRAADRDPEKIDFMINSHLHLDHAGGNALIPNARWVIQKREYAAAHDSDAQEKHYYRPRIFDLGHDRIEADGEHDVFGDGSVICIPTYGHTAGHQSLKLRLEGGEVILTGDACYMCRSLDEMRLPPNYLDNADEMLCSLHKFRDFRAAGGGLLYGHDPAQWSAHDDGPVKEITFEQVIRRSGPATLARTHPRQEGDAVGADA